MRQVFPAAATKGWDLLHKHNAELLKCAAALRDLKLLVGSGGLDFHKNIDSLHWQPHFQPTLAKRSILAIVQFFA